MVNPSELLVDKSVHGLGTGGVTSIGSRFDFNDVTYNIGHCNVDTRRCNVVFKTFVRSKRVSAHDEFL